MGGVGLALVVCLGRSRNCREGSLWPVRFGFYETLEAINVASSSMPYHPCRSYRDEPAIGTIFAMLGVCFLLLVE